MDKIEVRNGIIDISDYIDILGNSSVYIGKFKDNYYMLSKDNLYKLRDAIEEYQNVNGSSRNLSDIKRIVFGHLAVDSIDINNNKINVSKYLKNKIYNVNRNNKFIIICDKNSKVK